VSSISDIFRTKTSLILYKNYQYIETRERWISKIDVHNPIEFLRLEIAQFMQSYG